MSLLADLLATVFERATKSKPSQNWDERPIRELVAELIGNSGEVRGMVLARQILDRYDAMDDDQKRDFFTFLASDMDIDAQAVRNCLTDYEQTPSKATYRAFMDATEPGRQELVRRLNQVPGATGNLVAMRSDLLKFAQEDTFLAAIDLDFRHLFVSWFNRGFLVLRPINWESPAHILEKIIAYEAVHAIDSWEELRRRLQPSDRRCFAFFHPTMADEPLIFVEVALTRGKSSSIQQILADDRETIDLGEANTAVFYSISNCQAGLAGISFGNSLIKQVVQDLSHELPELSTFVTLSPIPGLVQNLQTAGWEDRPEQSTLGQLAAHYLTDIKRDDGMPKDPVARFHLGNGAMVHAVHTDADLSDKGLAQSYGAMVNYLYDLSAISQNHEEFGTGQIVAASPEVKALARLGANIISKDPGYVQSAI